MGEFVMIYRKASIAIAGGSAVGGISFMAESALIGILPPLAGLTRWLLWLPNAVLLLVSLGMGMACGFAVHVFTRLPKRLVLASAICSYALIEIATVVYLAANAPEDIAGFRLNSAGIAITLAHIGAFTIGAVAGYALKIKKERIR